MLVVELGSYPHMGIGANLPIQRNQRAIVDPRSCHNELIGWVAVECARQLSRLNCDPWHEFEQPHARVG
jgi:hypothetical protein